MTVHIPPSSTTSTSTTRFEAEGSATSTQQSPEDKKTTMLMSERFQKLSSSQGQITSEVLTELTSHLKERAKANGAPTPPVATKPPVPPKPQVRVEQGVTLEQEVTVDSPIYVELEDSVNTSSKSRSNDVKEKMGQLKAKATDLVHSIKVALGNIGKKEGSQADVIKAQLDLAKKLDDNLSETAEFLNDLHVPDNESDDFSIKNNDRTRLERLQNSFGEIKASAKSKLGSAKQVVGDSLHNLADRASALLKKIKAMLTSKGSDKQVINQAKQTAFTVMQKSIDTPSAKIALLKNSCEAFEKKEIAAQNLASALLLCIPTATSKAENPGEMEELKALLAKATTLLKSANPTPIELTFNTPDYTPPVENSPPPTYQAITPEMRLRRGSI